jgi:3-hydroxyisobutyrate dehydrogenase-like beta-hydroxyacid dehydrogenase
MKIGFIGLGAMGAGMARRLIEAGHNVTVHDAQEESLHQWRKEGIHTAESPWQLAQKCDVVLLSLPGDDVTEHVCLNPEVGFGVVEKY